VFANLTTDSDYNYLAEHVNANRFAGSAVTCCYERIFSTSPEFLIRSENFSARTTVLSALLNSTAGAVDGIATSLPLLSTGTPLKLRLFSYITQSRANLRFLVPSSRSIASRRGLKVQEHHRQVCRADAADAACLTQRRRANSGELLFGLGAQLGDCHVIKVGRDLLRF
jgi:hypothetical protein